MNVLLLMVFILEVQLVCFGSSLSRLRSNHAVRLMDGSQEKEVVGLDVMLPKPLQMVRAYLGLRYAALGKLRRKTVHRFMTPVATFKYFASGGTVYKDTFEPVCPQVPPDLNKLRLSVPALRYEHLRRIVPFLSNQSEECLFLNVYVLFYLIDRDDSAN